jgi:hypothetical protein
LTGLLLQPASNSGKTYTGMKRGRLSITC